MRIAIVSDAGRPQINGVVTTLEKTSQELLRLGHEVTMVTPADFRTIPCPTYPSIRLAIHPGAGIARILDQLQAEAIHIATEGPLGHAARSWCIRHGMHFTTSYHTQFPEYLRLRYPVPLSWSYRYLRHFHGAADCTMVATPSLARLLQSHGFENLCLWPRGVDTELFRPDRKMAFDLPGPIWLYLGRIAVEKNVEAFLALDLPGSKVLIGDGPDRERLSSRHPSCHFLGFKQGADLAALVASCDVCIFPSLTDTFGLVMLEAMAAGLPVAAYPVVGPVDVVESGVTGILDHDLQQAALAALKLDRQPCIDYARSRSWGQATKAFASLLVANPANRKLLATPHGDSGDDFKHEPKSISP